MSNYKASNFKKSEKIKLSNPGIYTNFKLTLAEKINKRLQFEFTDSESRYQNLALFYEISVDQIEKNVKANFAKKSLVASGADFKTALDKAIVMAEAEIVGKLVEIASAVGDPIQVDEIEGKDYTNLVAKLFKYIQDLKNPDSINLKVTVDYKGEWCEISKKLGNIEKHISGKDSKLFFTNWEIDNGRSTRPVKESKPSYKADEDVFGPPTASPASKPTVEDPKDENLPF